MQHPPIPFSVLYWHWDIPREEECRLNKVHAGSLQLCSCPKGQQLCWCKLRTRLSLTAVIQKKHRAGNNTAVQQKPLLQLRKYKETKGLLLSLRNAAKLSKALGHRRSKYSFFPSWEANFEI